MTFIERIMLPIDLENLDCLPKTLAITGRLARDHDAEVCYVGVSDVTPGRAAPNPEQFAAQLAEVAAEQGASHGIRTCSRAIHSVDPSVELDRLLLAEAEALRADLIIMPSHVPGLPDALHVISSHAAFIARHASMSVLVVR
jgi:nucleotide-binding universal stress UspA family protein